MNIVDAVLLIVLGLLGLVLVGSMIALDRYKWRNRCMNCGGGQSGLPPCMCGNYTPPEATK